VAAGRTTIPIEALTDRHLRRVVIEAGLAAIRQAPNLRQRLRWFFIGAFDPNDWRLVKDDATGIRYLPLTTDRHRRYGTRERVLDVARRYPDRLTISLNTVAYSGSARRSASRLRRRVPKGCATVSRARRAKRRAR
jgi:hypothetical protein